ncbi:MAG: LacI family transcriptional regulator [Spirochaetales bacterium]|nr:LacI family transcriptional regulator [Spirochaetales bacterium]
MLPIRPADMASTKVTIYDIADKLGTSVSTVSRALNNSRLVSDGKSRLIRDTAAQMGYQKRQIKRHAKRTILNIVLILPYREDTYMHLFYDPAQLIKGIEDGFGDTTISMNIDLDMGNSKIFAHKKSGNIDGVIFAFSDPKDTLLQILDSRRVPYIFLNRIKSEHNYICCDHRTGMMTLVRTIVEKRKAENLLFIGIENGTGVSEEREAGFREACGKFQISGKVSSISSIEDITPEFIDGIDIKETDALLCCNDYLGTTLYQALIHRNIRIPQDIALTGFDNSPIRNLFWERLTTIDLSVDQFGREAAIWLMNAIVNKEESRIQKLIAGSFIPGTTI